MKIIFCDINKSLREKVKKAIKETYNNTHSELIVSDKDILGTKKDYPNALIVTASNPDFTMNGGLDLIIKENYKEQCYEPREFKFTKDLFFVISCDKNIQSNRNIVRRALCGVYFANRKNDIILTGIGTSIAGLSEEDFIEEFKRFISANFSEVNFRYSNFRNSNFSNSDFSNSDFRYSDFSNSYFSNSDFRYSDFSNSYFSNSYFRYSDFSNSNFSNSYFRYSDFSNSYFSNSDFRYSDFSNSYFSNSYFRNSNFRYSNFRYSNFRNSDFRNSDFRNSDFRNSKFNYRILPEEGKIIGYKKAGNEIIKLEIDCETAVGGMIGRKCRCKKAKVLEITNNKKEIYSDYDNSFIYKVGEIVEVEDWNDKPYLECEKGIHFFITRQEAEDY